MNRYRIATGIFIFMLVNGINALSQINLAKFSLKQCVEQALANNTFIIQSGLQLQTTEANYPQAKNNRLPSLFGGYNFGINNGRSIDPSTNGYIKQQLNSSNTYANLDIPVFNGFRLQNSIKQNVLSQQSARADLQYEKDKLTLKVILTYLPACN